MVTDGHRRPAGVLHLSWDNHRLFLGLSQAVWGCLRLPATNLGQSWMVAGLILAQSGTGREIVGDNLRLLQAAWDLLILRSAQDDHKTGYSTHFCQECTRFYRNKGRRLSRRPIARWNGGITLQHHSYMVKLEIKGHNPVNLVQVKVTERKSETQHQNRKSRIYIEKHM